MSGRRGLSRLSPRHFAIAFLLGAVPAVLLLAFLMPPFENSDEFTHMDRVDQIALGALIGQRSADGRNAGGVVDPGIDAVDALIGRVRWHPDRRVDRATAKAAARIGWGGRRWTGFANTVVYAPVLYAPAVAAVLLGKRAHLTVVETLHLARIAEGVVAVVIAAWALARAGPAAPLLLAVLALPMSLSLFASVSQDGPMLALSGLAATAFARLHRAAPPSRRWLVVAALALALVGVGRPAYLPLGLVLLVVPRRFGVGTRLLAAAGAIAPAIGWSAIVAGLTVFYRDDVDPRRQLEWLAHHPLGAFAVARATFAGPQGMEGRPYWQEILGVLGWIDAPIGRAGEAVALAALAVATVAALPRSRPSLAPAGLLALAGALALGALAVFGLEYLTWTPVGGGAVIGVQGRYFLPLLVFVPLLLPPLGARVPPALLGIADRALLAFPAVAALIDARAIALRYWWP